MIAVEVVYATETDQCLLCLRVQDNATVHDVIEQSGILAQYSEIDLVQQKVGVFSRFVALDQLVRHGDRIEIYRPLKIDPKDARRRRAK